jgi:hypothetical protein
LFATKYPVDLISIKAEFGFGLRSGTTALEVSDEVLQQKY